jgi:hypothetical protein
MRLQLSGISPVKRGFPLPKDSAQGPVGQGSYSERSAHGRCKLRHSSLGGTLRNQSEKPHGVANSFEPRRKGDDSPLDLTGVYGLALHKTDLVVLSGCQSQSGKRTLGDDIIGLSQGLSKTDALRAAQVEVRRKYPSPFYWAGFVLTGDSGNSVAGRDRHGQLSPQIIRGLSSVRRALCLAHELTRITRVCPRPSRSWYHAGEFSVGNFGDFYLGTNMPKSGGREPDGSKPSSNPSH